LNVAKGDQGNLSVPMTAQSGRSLPRPQAGPAGKHSPRALGAGFGVVKIGNATAGGVWHGGTALSLGAQVDQPIGGHDLTGRDKAKAILWLGRTVKAEASKAMANRLECDELT
jgi:hypothetical protein